MESDVHMHINTHTHTHTHTHTCTHMHTHTCTHTCTHMHAHTHTHMHTPTHTHARAHAHTHTHNLPWHCHNTCNPPPPPPPPPHTQLSTHTLILHTTIPIPPLPPITDLGRDVEIDLLGFLQLLIVARDEADFVVQVVPSFYHVFLHLHQFFTCK